MKLRLAVLLTALIVSGVVAAQATLGNVVKLGTSTNALLPASSAAIEGGLIYNLDAGQVYFNNGTVWGPIASSIAGSTWIDAGAGYLYMPDGPMVLDRQNFANETLGHVVAKLPRGAAFAWMPAGSPTGTPTGLLLHYAGQWYVTGQEFRFDSSLGIPAGAFIRTGSYIGSDTPTFKSQASSGQTALDMQDNVGILWSGGGATLRLSNDPWPKFGLAVSQYVRVGSYTDAGLGVIGVPSAGAIAWNNSQGVLNVSDGTGWRLLAGNASATTLTSVYVNAAVTAATTYSLEPGPPVAFQINAMRFTITTAGSGGTTNMTLRASDGTNNCDCSIPCNSAGTTGYRVGCTGTCASFAANAGMTYSVTTIGDCTLGATILGNVTVEGALR